MPAADNRRYERVKPDYDIYAVLGAEKTIVGKLKDISMGGLSCQYLTDTEDIQKHQWLDIFTLDDKIYMNRVPYTVVYNTQVGGPEVGRIDSKVVKTRRCGVKFGDLSSLQKEQIKLLLATSTN